MKKSETNGYYSFYSCPSSLLAMGNFCLVYGEDKLNIPETFARAVAAEFDARIYGTITAAFGSPTDLDRNGRVIILLFNIIEEASPDGAYTAGYFYYPDLFNYLYSNRAEMLYINYKNLASNNLYSAMAHELQHLINRSLHPNIPMDTWIDEGLASAAEYLYGGRQDGRIAWFNNDSRKTIQKGNNFFIWNGSWENAGSGSDVLSNYATAYLFFQWLRIHAANGSRIYGDIINSQYTDYRAVTNAARLRILAFSGISDDDAGWAKLLGDWYAANRLRAESGIYGYEEKITLYEEKITLNFTWGWPGSGSGYYASLYPGEGVYSLISSNDDKNPLTGTPTIRYLGLNTSGIPVESPLGNSEYLLTYNGSTSGNSAETGYVADPVPVSASRFRAMAAGSGEEAESPEAILRRWDGGRVFLERLRDNGTLPVD